MDPLELTGRSETHVVPVSEKASVQLHRQAADSFRQMRKAAAADGIALEPISGFRDFRKQASIWDAKWRGERTLHDVSGNPVEFATLSESERAHTILIWSALPGASRHHWGTDVDVLDANARPPGYEVQLLPHEYLNGGMFHKLHEWLERRMAEFGFFFPYKNYNGGISTEPWHISYAPISVPALGSFSLEALRNAIEASEIEGKTTVLEMLPEIFERYVTNIDLPETEKPRP